MSDTKDLSRESGDSARESETEYQKPRVETYGGSRPDPYRVRSGQGLVLDARNHLWVQPVGLGLHTIMSFTGSH